jgi:hypothetical protein
MLQESATTAWDIRTMYYTPSTKEMDAACRPDSVALCVAISCPRVAAEVPQPSPLVPARKP